MLRALLLVIITGIICWWIAYRRCLLTLSAVVWSDQLLSHAKKSRYTLVLVSKRYLFPFFLLISLAVWIIDMTWFVVARTSRWYLIRDKDFLLISFAMSGIRALFGIGQERVYETETISSLYRHILISLLYAGVTTATLWYTITVGGWWAMIISVLGGIAVTCLCIAGYLSRHQHHVH